MADGPYSPDFSKPVVTKSQAVPQAELNRREFLKKAGKAVVAGAVVGGVIGAAKGVEAVSNVIQKGLNSQEPGADLDRQASQDIQSRDRRDKQLPGGSDFEPQPTPTKPLWEKPAVTPTPTSNLKKV